MHGLGGGTWAFTPVRWDPGGHAEEAEPSGLSGREHKEERIRPAMRMGLNQVEAEGGGSGWISRGSPFGGKANKICHQVRRGKGLGVCETKLTVLK